MLKSIGKILLHLATGATIATVALLWISAYSAHIPPEKHGWLDVLGLCFPSFAAGNAAALLGWLIPFAMFGQTTKHSVVERLRESE